MNQRMPRIFFIVFIVSIVYCAFKADTPFVVNRPYKVNYNIVNNNTVNYPDIIINVAIKPDGSMLVEEKFIPIDWYDYCHMHRLLFTDMFEIMNITVEENGIVYSEADTYKPGTYTVGDTYIKLYRYKDERRKCTYNIKYKILNAVNAYEDIAEFYYHVLMIDSYKHAKINLSLPYGARLEEVRAWSLYGDVKIIDSTNIIWETNLSRSEGFLGGRVTFPTQLVPGVKKEPGQKLPEILREQKARESEKRLIMCIAVLPIVLSIIIAFFNYWRYGREFKPKFQENYYREVPVTYAPALAGYLYRRKTNIADFLATILDLGRRGLLKIEEYEREVGIFFKSKKKGYYLIKNYNDSTDTDTLEPYEELLLKFIFKDIDYGDKVSFSSLEKFNLMENEKFISFWTKWKSSVKKSAEQLKLFDEKSDCVSSWQSLFGIAFNLLLGMLCKDEPLALSILTCSGVILVVSSFFIYRRSEQGIEDLAKLKAFRRFLLDFSNMQKNDIPSMIFWEHYLVYAVPLGVATTVEKQLNIDVDKKNDDKHKHY